MKNTMFRNSLKKSLFPQITKGSTNILNSHTSGGKPLSIPPPLTAKPASADQEPELLGLCFRTCK
ncbi:MAG: hypothetical protein WBO73_01245 [Gammaproteobacteria bacterium]